MKIETKLNRTFSEVYNETDGNEEQTFHCYTEGNEEEFEPCYIVRVMDFKDSQQVFVNDMNGSFSTHLGEPFNLPRDKKEFNKFLKAI